MQAREGCQLVIIDYLQRIRGVRTTDRYEAVTELSIAVSDIAKTNKLAILCLCQLNRGTEHREDKEPTMADLRDSGQIEQDFDTILMLYRESYYQRQTMVSGAEYGTAVLIVSKMRDGIRGLRIPLRTQLQYQRFVDVDDEQSQRREAREVEDAL
jgi:replicative DNA helicase